MPKLHVYSRNVNHENLTAQQCPDRLLHFLLITIYELIPRSDPTLEVTMFITFSHEKPQASIKSHK